MPIPAPAAAPFTAAIVGTSAAWSASMIGLNTSRIVAAHVSNNTVSVNDLPGLIEQVYTSLNQVGGEEVSGDGRPAPAIPVKKSITPDYIICLEDGKSFKMLKKHLKTKYNMTPEDYRIKWGLPADYPMVAPNYAAKRQQLAKESGLGKNR